MKLPVSPDYRVLFESVPGLLLVVLPDDPRYTIVTASDEYLRTTLTVREEIVGCSLLEVVSDNPPSVQAAAVRNLVDSLRRVVEKRQPDSMGAQRYGLRGRASEGGESVERWWSPVNSPVFGKDGKLELIIHRIEDVTELTALKDTHRRLRDTQDEWISLVAHELRQPMAILTLSALSLSRLLTSSPTKAVEAAERIARNVAMLDRMISDLLDASRVDARRLAVDLREIDLGDVIRRAVERMPDVARRCAAQLGAGGGHAPAYADPDRVEQVVANLLSNAAKFGDPKTEILVTLDQRPKEDEVAVTNFGTGIDPAELPHVFDRFHRGHGVRQSGVGGLGLGLYIAKHLVEAQGGRMWAESRPGRTTFRFTLPKRAEAR